jgi:acetyl esterase/lipase
MYDMLKPETYVYATFGDIELALDLVRPIAAHQGPAPAIIFFHGGGWREGTRDEFLPHCRRVAAWGAIGVTASFRLASEENGTTPVTCVEDALRAIQWIYANAEQLGVNPDRIVAAGGSSGGQMAGAAATQGAPVAALVLFSPGLTDDGTLRFAFMGDAAAAYQPSRSFPPTLIIHGTADEIVSIDSARSFHQQLVALGVHCELVELDKFPHDLHLATFPEYFERTLAETQRFLVSVC